MNSPLQGWGGVARDGPSGQEAQRALAKRGAQGEGRSVGALCLMLRGLWEATAVSLTPTQPEVLRARPGAPRTPPPTSPFPHCPGVQSPSHCPHSRRTHRAGAGPGPPGEPPRAGAAAAATSSSAGPPGPGPAPAPAARGRRRAARAEAARPRPRSRRRPPRPPTPAAAARSPAPGCQARLLAERTGRESRGQGAGTAGEGEGRKEARLGRGGEGGPGGVDRGREREGAVRATW